MARAPNQHPPLKLRSAQEAGGRGVRSLRGAAGHATGSTSSWRGGLRLAASLLVLVQLAGVAHLAFARHGVCWEHGVVVELDAVPSSPAAAEPSAIPGLDRSVLQIGRSEGHPHCPALWLHRQLGPTRAPELALARPLVVDAVVVRDSVPPPRWAVLLRAPKQSPPV